MTHSQKGSIYTCVENGSNAKMLQALLGDHNIYLPTLNKLSGKRLTSLIVLASSTGSSLRRNIYEVFPHALSLLLRDEKVL